MDRTYTSIVEAANRRLFADRDAEAVDEFFAPDYVAHTSDRDMTGGPVAVRSWLAKLYDAFSDLEVAVEVLVESEDRIAWWRTVSGTQDGSFMGFPASGRRIVWRDLVTSRLEKGRIVEEWAVSSLAEHLLRARIR